MLARNLLNLRAQPGWVIAISGHSDASGNSMENLTLSRTRAQTVKDWIQHASGIPERCFLVKGFGAMQPIASNDTEQGRTAQGLVQSLASFPEGAIPSEEALQSAFTLSQDWVYDAFVAKHGNSAV